MEKEVRTIKAETAKNGKAIIYYKGEMKMFEEIKTIVAENLGVEEDSITMESSFKDDLKADSLDLFEMVMALEENYGIEIPTDDLGQLETVADVIDYIQSHKE